ncbi:MAG: aldehyde dehydrogenase [Gammaproteobacteria bacterium RIFCSPHIGHO2_12_FULL_41_20]|nr:MAG: aldehyde dehydrogenase [Gammaproteobacteria bacterium RIFCSPHIGHO2_12_FULL_41_20]
MLCTDYKELLETQRNFFATGVTQPVVFRIKQLKMIKTLLQTHEDEIISALYKDLHKPAQETVLHEILLVIKEIDFIIKHLKKWARSNKVSTPLFLWPGRSAIYYEPYGCTLIIGAWNYPLMLILSPLIGAISAGNCAIVKPSEIAVHTQALLVKLIAYYFPPEYIAVVTAGPVETMQLLQEKFDYIFFTGSTQIGKKVLEAAAKHLTPVTLELGGKNPCIVTSDANLDYAARRIIWAKTINAGQTCIAPDYVYVQRACKDKLLSKLQNALLQFYGDTPQTSRNYGRIINYKQLSRLSQVLHDKNAVPQEKSTADNALYFAPTLIDNVTWQDAIMQEEVFGPLLPILTYDDMDEVIHAVNARPKPLALYLFTRNQQIEKQVLTSISFGGGCINDCILHIANYHLPFGGVGASGMGCYHGHYSFATFSHRKSIYKKHLLIELKLEYPPYNKAKLTWLRRLLKW